MAQNQRLNGMNMRRLRASRLSRELVREVRVSSDQMIQPHFVVEGLSKRQEVPGLTGVFRETPDSLLKQVERDLESGAKKLILFGVPQKKSERSFDHSFVANQIAALKKRFGSDLWVSVDVCLCSHTTHGHCGVLSLEKNHVENGATVDELARAGLAYAQAGADCVAPSDMMDGRVGAIRTALDSAGLERTL